MKAESEWKHKLFRDKGWKQQLLNEWAEHYKSKETLAHKYHISVKRLSHIVQKDPRFKTGRVSTTEIQATINTIITLKKTIERAYRRLPRWNAVRNSVVQAKVAALVEYDLKKVEAFQDETRRQEFWAYIESMGNKLKEQQLVYAALLAKAHWENV